MYLEPLGRPANIDLAFGIFLPNKKGPPTGGPVISVAPTSLLVHALLPLPENHFGFRGVLLCIHRSVEERTSEDLR